ncbi:MAG TPA: hypothetical protein VEK57_12930 [Thermoanaerobaculia bacterium]|nr:hypothetical protein [Thermoanaerobaculia bacterium]
MNIDPFDPQLLADYDYFCRRFGPMPLPEFMALWQAAGEWMEVADLTGSDLRSFPTF